MTDPISDDELDGLLARLGWSSPPRRTIDHVVETLREHGYVVSPAAEELINEFDGLTFTHPRHPAAGGSHTTLFDGLRAARAVDIETVRAYERRVGQGLCPVGLANSNHVILMVAESGEIYGGYDDYLARYGRTGRRTIWNLVHRVPTVRV